MAERLADPVQHRRQRLLPAQHAAGRGRPAVSDSALARAACLLRRAAPSTTELTTSPTTTNTPSASALLASAIVNVWHRRGEVVVEQQRGRDRLQHGGHNPPTSATAIDARPGKQDVAGQVQAVAQAGQRTGSAAARATTARAYPASCRRQRQAAADPGRPPAAAHLRVRHHVHVDVAGSPDRARAHAGPGEQGRQPVPAAHAEHELGGVLGPGEGQQGLGHVIARRPGGRCRPGTRPAAAARPARPGRPRSGRPTWSRARRAGRRRTSARRSGRRAG